MLKITREEVSRNIVTIQLEEEEFHSLVEAARHAYHPGTLSTACLDGFKTKLKHEADLVSFFRKAGVEAGEGWSEQ